MSDWDSQGRTGWDRPGREDDALTAGTPAYDDKGPRNAEKEATREWKLVEKLVMSLQAEQRRSRRWGIFFKFLTFAYLFGILIYMMDPLGSALDSSVGSPHTALIEVTGTIAADQPASADNLVGALRRAFEAEQSEAVLLRINSPGGSPVQSGYVYDEIVRLRGLHPDKKLYAVITDIGASGAYYIAAAADEIYADKASLVGSIGVISGGFGFSGLIDQLGIERRLYAAGDSKAFLDPFSPEREEDVAFWQGVLENTHQQFIDQVRKGRGDRLQEDERLFSGLIWNGEQALELGLVDGLGSSSWVARERVGNDQLVDYSPRQSTLRQLVDQLGVSMGRAAADILVQSRFELR